MSINKLTQRNQDLEASIHTSFSLRDTHGFPYSNHYHQHFSAWEVLYLHSLPPKYTGNPDLQQLSTKIICHMLRL